MAQKNKSKIKNQKSAISFWHPASLVATCFGIGKIPFAPGTWGSLAAFIFLIFWGDVAVIMLLPILLVGLYCASIYEKSAGKHDSKEIVIDEVVGQIISSAVFFFLFASLANNNSDSIKFVIGVMEIQMKELGIGLFSSFLLFRFFDIVKPGPVGWADRNVKGAWGVMLDDIIAGVLAGITSALIFLII